jgi:hypothetical protein
MHKCKSRDANAKVDRILDLTLEEYDAGNNYNFPMYSINKLVLNFSKLLQKFKFMRPYCITVNNL